MNGEPAAQVLRYNPHNASTLIVERVPTTGGTRVCKRLRPPGATSTGPAHWASSDDPTHWNFWHREAEVYTDEDLRARLSGTGLDLAGAHVADHPGSATLWLEDVAGTAGPEFALGDHVATASALGRWQGRPPPSPPWASRRFLRAYSTSRPGDLSLVGDDAAWDQPLIRATWPPGLREGWERLVAHREQLLATMEALPRTLCHLDAWVANAIRRPDGAVVLVDWAFAGDGALGEDLGNWLPDAVFDLFWPAEHLADLEAACYPAYLQGLRQAGWRGAEADVRLGVVASAVKYAWLLPLLLAHASDAEHHAYHRRADPERLYRERGIALAHLAGWADEALDAIS